MALIPPFFLNCVVSIGIQAQNQTNWIGSGFIVGRLIDSESSEKIYNTFLVTNKHVIQNKASIIIRFNDLRGGQVLDYSVDLVVNGREIWIGHPSPDIDVATFLINARVLKENNAEFSFFQLEEHTMCVADMIAEGVSEGDGIFILGFPMGIVAPQRKHVITRVGAIARIRDVLDGHQLNYLVDANIFPGNSGGPVVIRPDINSIGETKSINRAALIGIVKSYVPYNDVAISQQTGNPRVIFEENSGLALVETVDSVKETVEICFAAIV